MSDYSQFTSLPPHEEAAFVVFERNTQESLQKAFMIGMISAVSFGLLALGIYFGVSPKKDDTAKDMDMQQLKTVKKAPTAEAPKPDK
jgi:hypothetical protein